MYIQVQYNNISEQEREILIAQLSHLCEGFEEQQNNLSAVMKKENYTPTVQDYIHTLKPPTSVEEIAEQNWNTLWESNVEPVVIPGFVAVRAHFHPPVLGVEQELIITPKMSFGTGHHATTLLMMEQMRQIDFGGKSVFDFGTGTGILAILAKKLGAGHVLATDIDTWSIENARSNFYQNNAADIQLRQCDGVPTSGRFDVILANINKNVLRDAIPLLAGLLPAGGLLLLSGLLCSDEAEIVDICRNLNIHRLKNGKKGGWIVLVMSKL